MLFRSLASLVAQITKILSGNVSGKKKEGVQLSLGQRALMAFGYITSNEQLVREAWDKARKNTLVMLREEKAKELGRDKLLDEKRQAERTLTHLNDLAESGSNAQKMSAPAKIARAESVLEAINAKLNQISSEIKSLEPEFIKRRDELMSEVPRQLYSTGQARSVIREAIEDKYETTKIGRAHV